MLKAYFWKPDRDSDDGLPVIAENASEAKRLAAAHWSEEFGFDDPDWYICQRVNRIPDANIDGLRMGVPTDWKDCLRRGLISWTEGEKCDGCGEESNLSEVRDGKCLCDGCVEEAIDEEDKE